MQNIVSRLSTLFNVPDFEELHTQEMVDCEEVNTVLSVNVLKMNELKLDESVHPPQLKRVSIYKDDRVHYLVGLILTERYSLYLVDGYTQGVANKFINILREFSKATGVTKEYVDKVFQNNVTYIKSASNNIHNNLLTYKGSNGILLHSAYGVKDFLKDHIPSILRKETDCENMAKEYYEKHEPSDNSNVVPLIKN